MSTELSPKERPEAFELLQQLRAFAKSLRKFLDTEDFSHFEQALNIHETIKESRIYGHLSGHLDIDNNIGQLRTLYEKTGGKIDDLTFGRMLDQVVYTIVRTNIVSAGLEFKLKRMRKG